MNRNFKAIVFVIFSSISSQYCFSQESFERHCFEWYLQNSEGVLSEIQKSQTEALPFVNLVLTIWEGRDGAIGDDISVAVEKSIVSQTELAMSWFKVHPESFDGFINEMQGVLFTDYSGGTSKNNLEKAKQEMLEALSKYRVENKDLVVNNMIRQLISALNKIEVRVID